MFVPKWYFSIKGGLREHVFGDFSSQADVEGHLKYFYYQQNLARMPSGPSNIVLSSDKAEEWCRRPQMHEFKKI
jgi:hypothetical protein